MHQINRNSEMLYEIATKVFIINSTIHCLIWHFDAMQYESNILHYFQTRISRVHTSLYALHGDTDSLFEYMRILASQELNPTIIPPDILKGMLHKIEGEIKSNARLKLCKDPETNIWSYYGTVKLTTHCVARLPDANSDCNFSGSILTYESVQSSQSTHVTSNLECACAI